MTIPTPNRRCTLCGLHEQESPGVTFSTSSMQAEMPSRFMQWACATCRRYTRYTVFDLPHTERHDRFAQRILTIREPWAWLIGCGYKDVENRSWSSTSRGRTLIHAASQMADDESYARAVKLAESFGIIVPEREWFEPRLGTIVAVTSLSKMMHRSPSSWFFGPYAWSIEWAWPVTSPRVRGQQRIWLSEAIIPITVEA
jgi:hypothetical protein